MERKQVEQLFDLQAVLTELLRANRNLTYGLENSDSKMTRKGLEQLRKGYRLLDETINAEK